MILLATLLSFGWPKERTTFTDVDRPISGLVRMTISPCCGSMRPALHGGEIAFVELYHKGMELHVGEIASDGTVLHRIVALSKDGVKLAGDANRYSDPWESRDNLQYIVRVIVRRRD